MVQQLRGPFSALLPEDLGSVSNANMGADGLSSLQFCRLSLPLLVSMGTAGMWCTDANTGRTPRHIK